MSTRSRETLIPVGPVVAAIGAIMLIVSLFLDWYGSLTAWEAFEVVSDPYQSRNRLTIRTTDPTATRMGPISNLRDIHFPLSMTGLKGSRRRQSDGADPSRVRKVTRLRRHVRMLTWRRFAVVGDG